MAAASVNNPPLLTGKRKRATVSYAELEDAFDLDGYDQNVERSDDAAILDDDQDESFGTRRKVGRSNRGHHLMHALTS